MSSMLLGFGLALAPDLCYGGEGPQKNPRRRRRQGTLIALLGAAVGLPLAPWAAMPYEINTTLGNGYLGSRIDEERSKMRYLV